MTEALVDTLQTKKKCQIMLESCESFFFRVMKPWIINAKKKNAYNTLSNINESRNGDECWSKYSGNDLEQVNI